MTLNLQQLFWKTFKSIEIALFLLLNDFWTSNVIYLHITFMFVHLYVFFLFFFSTSWVSSFCLDSILGGWNRLSSLEYESFLYNLHQQYSNITSKIWEFHFHTSINKKFQISFLICFLANRNPILWNYEEGHRLYFYILRFNLSKSKMLVLVISTGLWKLLLDLILCQDNTTHFFP